MSFNANPHLPLISIKCHPYHFSHSAVIVGDAAHAMVPFYGQGMNSGLEDVRVLFSILDKYSSISSEDNITPIVNPSLIEHQVAQALEEYSAIRTIDGAAINDLALQNYIEMRASVISPTYRLRKFLEETLSAYFPSLGWQTKYSRVSFGNERYSEIIKQSERQGKILAQCLLTVALSPILITAVLAWRRWRVARGGTGWFMKWWSFPAWKTS
jgi:kynurenine 3-monooxygenase